MVDTALRPRPNFATFLRSDANKGGDALTYYDFQRALRSQKVAILQQKRWSSYQPGYKKLPAEFPITRKVFQLKNKSPGVAEIIPQMQHAELLPAKMEGVMKSDSTAHIQEPQMKRSASMESVNSIDSNITDLEPSQSKTNISALVPSSASVSKISMTEAPPQTEMLPQISKKTRLVKSATSRDRFFSPSQPQRPQTVGCTRNVETQTMQGDQLPDGIPLQNMQNISSATQASRHRRALSEGSNDVNREKLQHGINLAEREKLCKAYQWGTTTQRAYDAAGWSERIPALPVAVPPTTTIEQFPDPVSQRLTFRRYSSEPATWQAVGCEWDRLQSRQCNTYTRGPQGIDFHSIHKGTQQIPGHTGYIPADYGENSSTFIPPKLLVRTLKPRYTSISRRHNIPGYTGRAHWTTNTPAHSNMPFPEPTTSARTHRMIPLEDEMSPFRRDGILSKMVTTVSPFNPFNNIQY